MSTRPQVLLPTYSSRAHAVPACFALVVACASGGNTALLDISVVDGGRESGVADARVDAATDTSLDSAPDARLLDTSTLDVRLADTGPSNDTTVFDVSRQDSNAFFDSGFTPTVRDFPANVFTQTVGEDTSRGVFWTRPFGASCPAIPGNLDHCYFVELVFRNPGAAREFTFTVEPGGSLSDTVLYLYRSPRLPADLTACAAIGTAIRDVPIAQNEAVTLVVSAASANTHGAFTVRVSGAF